ncbi:hypothetical protein QR685DRAFT_510069 [Neurospora intermedia]|uniref:Secreted protein n=1 Tax=Neurospora intermedia TaxID=5142 RepID=A0ABR3DPC6_NEUIN
MRRAYIIYVTHFLLLGFVSSDEAGKTIGHEVHAEMESYQPPEYACNPMSSHGLKWTYPHFCRRPSAGVLQCTYDDADINSR